MPFDTSLDTIEEISEFRKECMSKLIEFKMKNKEIQTAETVIQFLKNEKNKLLNDLKILELKYKNISDKANKEGIFMDFYSVFIANIEKNITV